MKPAIAFQFRRGTAKNWFFDRTHVIQRIGKAKAEFFRIAGYRVRQTARQSLKPGRRMSEAAYQRTLDPEELAARKRTLRILKATGKPNPKTPFAASRPGETPRQWEGSIKHTLIYALQPERDVVVIGPQLMGSKSGGAEALNALEYGGNVRLTAGPDRGQMIHIKARPFMQPALAKRQPEFADLWKDRL